MKRRVLISALVACAWILTGGCAEETAPAQSGAPAPKAEAPAKPDKVAAPALKTDKGVNGSTKKLTLGALNDESGPAAVIGKPYAMGKRLVVEMVNAGKSGLLPEGWKVDLVERDHGYNPQKSVAAYNEIKDDVLFVMTSFGTPNTLPLRPMLDRDKLVAFPASLSSQMAENPYTPPLGASYVVEAMRAMDWAVESAGGADKVKAGVVYQNDDYGKDGLAGWKKAAAHHGVTVVSEQTVAPGQKDFAAVVTGLKGAGATHILLVTLPSATGPVLGTAAQLKYMPIWIGATPTWIDAFFAHPALPAVVFTNFHWVSSLPYWGEKIPGMDRFLAAWEAHGKKMGKPDFYVLASYTQGLTQLEIAKRAIEAGDITRAGFSKAMQSVKGFDAGGLIQPIDLSKLPYVTGTRTRVLKPAMAEKTWSVAAPYAEPKAM